MSKDDTYNGWKNFETWSCHLWLTNDESMYHDALAVAREAKNIYQAADDLKEWMNILYGDVLPHTREGQIMMRDIGSLFRVDWMEIAKALREE